MDNESVAVEGDDDDGDGGEVDGEARRRLDDAAEEERAGAERPELGQHVHRGDRHREAQDCGKIRNRMLDSVGCRVPSTFNRKPQVSEKGFGIAERRKKPLLMCAIQIGPLSRTFALAAEIMHNLTCLRGK